MLTALVFLVCMYRGNAQTPEGPEPPPPSIPVINCNPVMSPFIHEWVMNPQSLNLTYVNMGGVEAFHFKTELLTLAGDTVLETDTPDLLYTMVPGPNMYDVAQFLPETSTNIYEPYASTIFSTGKLPIDNYTIRVHLVSVTNPGQDIAVAERGFTVTPYLAPGILLPYHNANIYFDYLSEIVFQWTPVTPDPGISIMYNFMIKEINEGQSGTDAFRNNPSVVELNVTDITNVTLPGGAIALLQAGKRYVWGVRAGNALTGDPIGSADGLTTPFDFNLTLDPSHMGHLLKLLPFCFMEGFEDGTLNGWSGRTGTAGNPNITWTATGIVPGRHNIVTPTPQDNYGLFNRVPPGGGNFAVQLGNSAANGKAQGLEYTFTVTPFTQLLTMSYALVLEDGGHPQGDQPFFNLSIFANRNVVPFGIDVLNYKTWVAQLSNPEYKRSTVNSGVIYRDWSCVNIDLSGRMGQTVTISLTTSDCAPGAHFGYAYIDFCAIPNAVADISMSPVVCGNSSPIMANASSSQNEENYFWEVAEADANWVVKNGTARSEWFKGQAGQIDVRNFYTSKGGVLKCNTYYKVKIAVQNSCTPWSESSALIYIDCPAQVFAGPDKCCPNGTCGNLPLGTSPSAGYMYAWSSNIPSNTNCLSNKNIPNPIFNPACMPNWGTGYISYTLSATSSSGCTTTDELRIYKQAPGNLHLTQVSVACGMKVIATGDRIAQYHWTWTENGQSHSSDEPEVIISPMNPTTLTLTASNACGNATISTTITPSTVIKGDFTAITYNSLITSSAPDLIITEWGKNYGVSPAYNATDYELYFLDRWGAWVLVNSASNISGLWNGQITWDGKFMGSLVPDGVYTLQLRMKNCSHSSWWVNDKRKFRKYDCAKWRREFFGIIGRKICVQLDPNHWTDFDETDQVITVTVAR